MYLAANVALVVEWGPSNIGEKSNEYTSDLRLRG